MSPPRAIALFVVTALIGAAGTVGASWAISRVTSHPAALPAATIALERQAPAGSAVPAPPSGAPVGGTADLAFQVQPDPQASPAPLPTLAPAERANVQTLVQTAAFVPTLRNFTPNWWNSTGIPRVPFITQFDGSPLQGYNCTLASGAMLARLAFGIVTTGAELRRFQSQASGGTTLGNLTDALANRFGASIQSGLLSPDQLRTVLLAGDGAVIQGNYGAVPLPFTLQASFQGGHAIYVDAYVPPRGDREGAYYVLDPIGRPWSYDGAWWPESLMLRFTESFSGTDGILAAWAPPGSVATGQRTGPIIPEPSFAGPGRPTPGPTPAPAGSGRPTPGPTPSPTASGAPGASAGASAGPSLAPPSFPTIPPPSLGPLPSFVIVPIPPGLVLSTGDTPPDPPPDQPWLTGIATIGGFLVQPFLEACLAAPTPARCPPGVPAKLDRTQFITPLQGMGGPDTGGTGTAGGAPGHPGSDGAAFDPLLAASTDNAIEMLGLDAARAGSVALAYRVPGGADSHVAYWPVTGSTADIATALPLGTVPVAGQPATVVSLDVLAGTAYWFQVVATVDGQPVVGPVGRFETASGVSSLRVQAVEIPTPASPSTDRDPYTVVSANAAGALVSCVATGASAQGAWCETSAPTGPENASGFDPAVTVFCDSLVTYGETTYCLGRKASGSGPTIPATCSAVRVTYDITGITASTVVVRALPDRSVLGLIGRVPVPAAGLETSGPAGAGTVTLGCLSPGFGYAITVSGAGAPDGVLAAARLAAAP